MFCIGWGLCISDAYVYSLMWFIHTDKKDRHEFIRNIIITHFSLRVSASHWRAPWALWRPTSCWSTADVGIFRISSRAHCSALFSLRALRPRCPGGSCGPWSTWRHRCKATMASKYMWKLMRMTDSLIVSVWVICVFFCDSRESETRWSGGFN